MKTAMRIMMLTVLLAAGTCVSAAETFAGPAPGPLPQVPGQQTIVSIN